MPRPLASRQKLSFTLQMKPHLPDGLLEGYSCDVGWEPNFEGHPGNSPSPARMLAWSKPMAQNRGVAGLRFEVVRLP